jgi:hypothetical protein
LSSAEFTESLAFESLEPDPQEMTMHLVAALLVWYANVHRDTRAKPKPYTIDDFLPNPYGPSRAEREAAFAKTMAQFERNRKARMAT